MPTRADYAVINIACKELGLDKKQLLSDRYGVGSSKDLSVAQVKDLRSHFRAQGFVVKQRQGGGKKTPRYRHGYQRKVVALWISLHKAGAIDNGSNQALQAYVKRMTGRSDLRFCGAEQCNLLIESLKKWGERHGVE